MTAYKNPKLKIAIRIVKFGCIYPHKNGFKMKGFEFELTSPLILKKGENALTHIIDVVCLEMHRMNKKKLGLEMISSNFRTDMLNKFRLGESE